MQVKLNNQRPSNSRQQTVIVSSFKIGHLFVYFFGLGPHRTSTKGVNIPSLPLPLSAYKLHSFH